MRNLRKQTVRKLGFEIRRIDRAALSEDREYDLVAPRATYSPWNKDSLFKELIGFCSLKITASPFLFGSGRQDSVLFEPVKEVHGHGGKYQMKVCGKDIKIQGRAVRIASPELDSYEPLDDPDAMLSSLRKCGVRVDLFTFMQLMPESAPKYPYPMEWDNLAVLPVSTFEHWWNHQIRGYPRNRARQAEKKGVTIREVPFNDALVQGIWEVYNESAVRQGKPNAHYGKDIETVRKEEATFLDRSIFVGAFLGENLIGFVKLVTDEHRTQANLMNIVSMIKHRDKAPTNALIAQSVRSCAERGMRYLLYQNFTYGNKKPDSLTKFKETNGFQRFDLPRYYIPLTLTGWLTLRLRLHHGLVNRLPESMVAKLRELRRAWYNRKLQTEPEGS